MALKVSDVMTYNIVFCHPDATVREIAKLMTEKRISSVIVSSESQIIGIVTERDLTWKVISAEKDSKTTKASEIMSAPVLTIDSEAEIEEAARLMRDHRIKKLVTVKNGKAYGIITSFDMIVAEPVIELFAEKSL
jgi:CBS domain-containing protein